MTHIFSFFLDVIILYYKSVRTVKGISDGLFNPVLILPASRGVKADLPLLTTVTELGLNLVSGFLVPLSFRNLIANVVHDELGKYLDSVHFGLLSPDSTYFNSL